MVAAVETSALLTSNGAAGNDAPHGARGIVSGLRARQGLPMEEVTDEKEKSEDADENDETDENDEIDEIDDPVPLS